MIHTARKYGTRTKILATTQDGAGQLPICKCLLEKHHISTVSDTGKLANYQNTDGHQESWYCRCNACTTIWNTSCGHPLDCIKLAKNLLETLPPKWNPANIPHINPNAPENEPNEWVAFPPSLITATTIKDIFRLSLHRRPSIMVATDRSTFDTGTTTARAGAGIFYQEGDPRNRSL
ncbi:hypothetical protein L208DRAFT_1390951 [Tricholoma matsutake]|nr:hypothetical protein L208DRAFT_1390951 [Tricholoma matsutake 945]